MKENIPFFVNLNYFATGEGATDSCALVWAYTKKEALEKFLRNTMLKWSTGKTSKKDLITL